MTWPGHHERGGDAVGLEEAQDARQPRADVVVAARHRARGEQLEGAAPQRLRVEVDRERHGAAIAPLPQHRALLRRGSRLPSPPRASAPAPRRSPRTRRARRRAPARRPTGRPSAARRPAARARRSPPGTRTPAGRPGPGASCSGISRSRMSRCWPRCSTRSLSMGAAVVAPTGVSRRSTSANSRRNAARICSRSGGRAQVVGDVLARRELEPAAHVGAVLAGARRVEPRLAVDVQGLGALGDGERRQDLGRLRQAHLAHLGAARADGRQHGVEGTLHAGRERRPAAGRGRARRRPRPGPPRARRRGRPAARRAWPGRRGRGRR